MKPFRWLLTFFTLVLAAVIVYAQNPVSISQLGTATPVTTTMPVSGTVTANVGTTNGLGLDATLSTIDTDLKANITLHAGSAVIGHVIADSGSTTAVTGNVASTVADGANVTLGAKADAKSTATDTTAVTIMQVLKEISAMEQAPASRAVTNAGTFATQSAVTAASGAFASGALASGSVASGAVASGAVASGAFAAGSISDGADVTLGTKTDAKSTATDGTSTSAISILKQISASVQAPPSQAVTNAGTFAAQATLQTQTDTVMVGGVNIKEINAVTPLMGNGATGTGALRVSIANDSTGVVQPGNTANTTPWLVQSVPGTANGLSTYTLEPGASDNHANIKNGAGVVYHIVAFNNSATINYYRLYNAATGFNGCNSATNLLWEGHIPASTSDAGFVEDIAQGITFSTGISICVTGAYGQTSTTNATASAISLNIGYK